MHIACLKGKELIEETKVKEENGNIKIKILGTEDKEIWLNYIPSLSKNYHKTYYTQIRNKHVYSIRRFQQ